jgi:general secretion pathway protein G
MERKNRKRKAFTLVELLVVVLIITMLAKMAIIENAIARFYIDCERYPDDSEGLEVLVLPPSDMEEGRWRGPYLKRSDLLDLWKNPYIYIAEGEYNPGSFDLVSLGADAMDGGEGDDADIIND